MNDAQNYFKAKCFKCGINVETPRELLNKIVQCPSCSKEFIAEPIKSIGKANASGLACPFCKSGNISEGQLRFTTNGMMLLMFGLFLAIALIGVFLIFAAFRNREVRYHCNNCKKTF